MKTGLEKRIMLREGHEVYTRKIGNGDHVILLLHGGPGGCHECFEDMENHIDLEKYSLIFYDQLGSYYSDDITDKSLLTLERYVDEIDQVRQAWDLDQITLLGHSWGGMLCIEYALKYQEQGHLKAIVISNMTASNDSYEKSVMAIRNKLLSNEEADYMIEVETNENYSDERYKELVYGKLYPECICRLEQWPGFFADEKMARIVYEEFQGDNEFVVKGSIKNWDRWGDLENISVPSIVIGAVHDTMSTEDKEKMAELIPNSDLLICPNGSHFAFLDDPVNYFKGLETFLSKI